MNRNNEDGYIVLITVLVLGAVVTIILGFILITGQNATLASSGVAASTSAKAGATGCAELALSAIQTAPTMTTPSSSSQTLNATSGETCIYTITGTSPNYTVVATGTVTQNHITYVRRLTVTTNQVLPSINITSWQDTP